MGKPRYDPTRRRSYLCQLRTNRSRLNAAIAVKSNLTVGNLPVRTAREQVVFRYYVPGGKK